MCGLHAKAEGQIKISESCRDLVIEPWDVPGMNHTLPEASGTLFPQMDRKMQKKACQHRLEAHA
jgi:hypothetical protein